MIKATFSKDKFDKSITMTLEGHAKSDDAGKDLICASASILAYTLAQSLQYIKAQGGIRRLRIKFDSGYARIKCYPTEDYYDVVLNTYFVTEVGLNLLAQNYPEYVKTKLFGEA